MVVEGQEITTDCIHEDCPNPENHMYVNPKKGVFKCFRCDFSGNFRELAQYFQERFNEPFSLEKLVGEGFDVKEDWRDRSLDKPFRERQKEQGDQPVEVLDEPDFYEPLPDDSYFGKKATNYLLERGISRDLMKYYNLGYGRGDEKGYIIIPVLDEDGEFLYYIKRRFAFKSLMRYSNPSNKDVPRGKSEVIFNYCRVEKGQEIFITEGVFDAIAMGKNAVSILGKTMSDTQYNMICQLDPKRVTVCLDADARQEAADIAYELKSHFPTFVIFLDEGDPDDLSTEERIEALNSQEEWNFGKQVEHKLLGQSSDRNNIFS